MANYFLWTVLITSVSKDNINTTFTVKYIVSAVTADLAVSYACRLHNTTWRTKVVKVQTYLNETNVISLGKI